MSSDPGGSGVVEHFKKRNARRTTFLLGGRSRVGNALGSIPAKCCGGTSGWYSGTMPVACRGCTHYFWK